MRKVSLTRKSIIQFAICVVVLLLLATPLFYLLTKNFYAEDMIDIIEAVKRGRGIPPLDLEQHMETFLQDVRGYRVLPYRKW